MAKAMQTSAQTATLSSTEACSHKRQSTRQHGHRPNNRKSIDHICISPQFRRSLLHVRVKRGADAASDHHLRIARVRLKLRGNYKPRNLRIKDNVHYHKDNDTVQSFWVSLSYRIQPLQDLSMGDE